MAAPRQHRLPLPPQPGPPRPCRRPRPRRRPGPAGPVPTGTAISPDLACPATIPGPPAGTGPGAMSTATIAARTDAGLVDVISTLGYQNGTAEGTGMVLTASGEVLTNNHVIAGATSIKVRHIGNGRTC